MFEIPNLETLKHALHALLSLEEDRGPDSTDLTRLERMHRRTDEMMQLHENIKQPDESESLGLRNGQVRNNRMIAYIRSTEPESREHQRQEIESYCHEHNIVVTEWFDWDKGTPGTGLHDALEFLRDVDGMIVSDLLRFEEHPDDPLRDLTPLINDRFLHNYKRLVSIKEGIDTVTPAGKRKAIEYINQLRDVQMGRC